MYESGFVPTVLPDIYGTVKDCPRHEDHVCPMTPSRTLWVDPRLLEVS